MSTSPRKGTTATRRARNLLVELGTEELPPKSLKKLAESLATSMYQSLLESGVVSGTKNNHGFYASPRRLAVWVKGVAPRQPDRVEQRRGPAVAAAFDADGNATRAAQGFAKSCGVEADELDRLQTDKGEWLVFNQKVSGEDIEVVVSQALDNAIRRLPVAKRMRWGSHTQEFVRPVHWLLAMYGADPLKLSVLGLDASPWSYGHRFHAPGRLRIRSADRYLETLKKDGHVMADYAERRRTIEKQVNRVAARQRVNAVIDPDLLDEVTGLVEWPQALYGEFDRRFLEVPEEVLVSSMRDHQKYFHLVDDLGRLQPGFITVSNIKARSTKRVRAGNERVLRARLADAEFFWQNDQKTSLADRGADLGKVLFHKKLGSIADKVARMRTLANVIAKQIDADPARVDRACCLCKNDLVTDMVGEFPELQGTIGSYYAANEGEAGEVCDAIRGHYQPRFAGDELPGNKVSQCLALADRLDSLAGIFAAGEVPTGDKDPFGLRRAALGVLRILIEQGLDLDLRQLVRDAMSLFAHSQQPGLDTSADTIKQLYDFIVERLRAYYQPAGFAATEIAAVMAVNPTRPLDFHHRLLAVQRFYREQTEAAESLAAANKRIANILDKQAAGRAGGQTGAVTDPALFREAAETELASQVEKRGGKAGTFFAQANYQQGLLELASLRHAVDDFFDDVMVMDDDPAVRNNRLALLASIRALFLDVADISMLRAES